MATKVLIVNDSLMVQQLLKRIVLSDPGFELAGMASDGFNAIHLNRQEKPDVILMDIRMPRCDGVEATKHIMGDQPTAILLVTATIKLHMPHIYHCLANGALEVVKTPGSVDGPASDELKKRIKIVHALRANFRVNRTAFQPREGIKLTRRPAGSVRGGVAGKVIAIGASTGGPTAVIEVLRRLPEDLGAGIIIVQHIDAEFAPGLAEWIDTSCAFDVFSAKKNDLVMNNTVYLAAENKDLIVCPGHRLDYQEPQSNGICAPCIDMTFKSIAQQYGANVIGVILTGMGDDGVEGLHTIRQAGGRTIAQDEHTSLIYGMPKEAKDRGAAEFVVPLHEMANKIVQLLKQI